MTGAGRPASKQQIGLYAEMLVIDLPPGAFCDASLKAMSEGAEYFPAYKVVKEALTTWYGQHGAPRVPQQFAGGLEPWLLDRVLDSCANNPGPMMRDWLGSRGVDVDAAIGERSVKQARDDWSDPAKIRASVAKLAGHPAARHLGNIVGIAVARHAPHNLGLVPPEYHPVSRSPSRDPQRLPDDPMEAF